MIGFNCYDNLDIERKVAINTKSFKILVNYSLFESKIAIKNSPRRNKIDETNNYF